MDTEDRWILVARYIAGECSYEEKEKVDSDPDLRALAKLLPAYMGKSNSREPNNQKWDVEQALKRVHESAGIAGKRSFGRRSTLSGKLRSVPLVSGWNRVPERRYMRTYSRIAALVVLALGFSYIAYSLSILPKQPPAFNQIAYKFSTGVGQQKQLLLSDGTQVILGPVSRFGLSGGFGRYTRTVRLEGEAYFLVKHHRMPFIVRTENGTIQDLGTEFDVKAWPGGSETEVAVKKGEIILKIGAASEMKGVLVSAGQRSAAVSDSMLTQPMRANLASELAWMQGSLIFDGTPLYRVLAQLRRNYPYNFSVPDSSLLLRKLTATYRKQPLDDIVKAIALSLNITYEKQGQTIVFGQHKVNSRH